MRKPIISRYRVDNVPFLIQPQFCLYGYGFGLLLFLYALVGRSTTKVKITGREKLKGNPNHIFSLWHSFVPLGLTSIAPIIPRVLDGAPQAWMQHPLWYMKPIHVLLRLMGVRKIILGSTGHTGQEAANIIVDYLRRGYSTVINPDGPDGPAFVLKKGILHLSLKSNVPIVPLQFSSSSYRELKTWDRKKIARPFSMLEIKIGEPIYVTKDNFEYAHNLLVGKMGRTWAFTI